MEANTKINVRGTMREMGVNEVLELPRNQYRPLSVRSTATLIRENYGMAYSVTINSEKIIVTRVS
ncbi:MAG: hypothetical protein LBG15_07215 [Dysgonamonadaceae bacterium]|jgi:hypothetical protein|nr:hypothetical protein [Dysgonamonadaceae bacterium]